MFDASGGLAVTMSTIWRLELSVSKQASRHFDMQRFDLNKVKDKDLKLTRQNLKQAWSLCTSTWRGKY
jgi:hypothetical protein